MTTTFDVSVVLCTYNRDAMLGDSLRSWHDVRQEGLRVEFIVVDNASTDSTRAVVERTLPGFPGVLRYEFEPQAGLSHARNRGIQAARGAIIAFVDDDIYFDAAWLQETMAAFRSHPEIHCVGGKSIPKIEAAKPDWLSESMLRFYGSTMSGDSDRPMVYPEHPFGVNMAFRREVFEQVGGFRTSLGRIKNSLLSNEEKDMFHRIDAAGLRVYYASQAKLLHRVPADRLKKEWLLKRAYWQGISDVVFEQAVNPSSRIQICKHLIRNCRRLLLGPGGKNPKRIYRYHRGYDFKDQIRKYDLLGAVRQDLVELLRSRSSQT